MDGKRSSLGAERVDMLFVSRSLLFLDVLAQNCEIRHSGGLQDLPGPE